MDDKWLTVLSEAVQSEVDSISQALTGRVKELAERYSMPLPEIYSGVESMSKKVDKHLEEMGYIWK